MRFLKISLVFAGVYNLLWGSWIVIFPMQIWELIHLPAPNYPSIWQCVGMIVGVYGIGYLVAARDPLRHWPIVLVGLLGKVFGPIGFVMTALRGDLPWRFGLINIFNDLIWWVPFAMVLLAASKQRVVRRDDLAADVVIRE